PAVVERIQDERDQTEYVEMNRARGVPAANENEQPDKQIQQADDPQIVFYVGGLGIRRRDYRGFKLLGIAGQTIVNLGPDAGAPQARGNLRRSREPEVVDRNQYIAFMHAGMRRRRIGDDAQRLNSVRCVGPDHAIVRILKQAPLLEIE